MVGMQAVELAREVSPPPFLPRYDSDMKVVKLSVSFDAGLAELVRERARKRGMSVSAWLAEAADDMARHEGLGELLDEWEAEHGAFTPEELAKAGEALGYTGPDAGWEHR